MISATTACLDRLSVAPISDIVEWACPVPYFGDPLRAEVATVGINPSNKEFVDDLEQPLSGWQQRLPTRHSLGLRSWEEAGVRELKIIDSACRRYFDGKPYDRWFRVLDALLSDFGATFYGANASACHLDLVPFATSEKWGRLSSESRSDITRTSVDLFARVLADSQLQVLVLNGRSVVETFEMMSGVRLNRTQKPEWRLPRNNGRPVMGVAYSGVVEEIDGYQLPHPMRVLGYNHNLQSSFGVTASVKGGIAGWIAEELAIESV